MSDSRADGARTADETDEFPLVSVGTRVLVAIRSSFLVFVLTVGVLLIVGSLVVSGLVLPGIEFSIVSAMLLIWGVSALIYAVLGRIGLRLIGYS